jgi:hypothetical protein
LRGNPKGFHQPKTSATRAAACTEESEEIFLGGNGSHAEGEDIKEKFY